MIEYPLVVILTHRKGCALALLRHKDDTHFLTHRSPEKTAENLLEAYLGILSMASYCASQIKTLAVGTGPGSFTGLRLGCAFANGIALGQGCALLSIQTEFAPFFLKDYPFENQDDLEEFKRQLGPHDPKDDSSGAVTFFDVQEAIQKIKNNQFQKVTILEPQYGREPGPVIKLRGIQNAGRSSTTKT